MVELRFHGRGGQGVVLASEILAHALFLEGREVQSFPSFGAERRGAPVMAFVRSDSKPIRTRTEITTPDHVMVMASALIKMGVNFTKGLKDKGTLLLNFSGDPSALSDFRPFSFYIVDAVSIAVKHGLGRVTAPIVNCVMLGALVGATGLVKQDTLAEAIRIRLSIRPEDNIKAALDAAQNVRLVSWEQEHVR